ncbi:MAG: carboxymuconolactone decarboxylase family protein [Candidatus Aminicenantes bacterium]|jgi:AhpD family alkylhydroperoxidase|nr:carboxymuconolactone decarboxylase family protein [Candidatus Aminicenantes bacterium]
MGRYEDFIRFRQEMNKKILEEGTLEIKRFFGLDEQTYKAGALDEKTKELMGLVASMVLRCDDCISYHLIQALEKGASQKEIFETFSVALIVGGSIIIPHLRRAVAFLEELKAR